MNTYLSEYAISAYLLETIRKYNVIITIIISFIGLLGHSLTIYVFAQKRFRKNSSNVFLLCLAINDGLYLITHFFEDTIRSTYIHANNQFNLIFILDTVL